MPNEMIQYSKSDFLALVEGSDVAEALRENLVEGDSFSEGDLLRVKTPAGGGLHWDVDGQLSSEIEGILVFNCRQGLLWKSLDIDKNRDKPIVRSSDLVYGKLNVPEEEVPPEMLAVLKKHEVEGQPGVYNWADLPYTQFGTGRNGQGKFAKESRVLFILRKGDAWPLIVKCGAGSIGEVQKFIKRLQVPQYRAVIGLSLRVETSKGGIDYSQIVPKYKGCLTAAEGADVKNLYTDRLRASHESGRVFSNDGDE